MYVLNALARLSRPLHLLLAALTYVLGAGVARYLGVPIRLHVALLGLMGSLLTQASMGLLAAVFRPAREPMVADESDDQRRTVRNAALYASIAALCATAVAALVMQRSDGLSISTLFCMVLSLVVILLYAVPPVRANDRGFGELLLAVQIAYLFPSIGFLVQAGSYHRLLNACIVALTLLLLATLVALEFPSYASDLKQERTTLLTRIGWLNALRAHHALLVSAYLLMAFAAVSGFSVELFLPAFLTIPFAVLQVLLLRRIAQGARPIWNLLSANAVAIFGLTSYFLALSFWLR
jgi:1,4-dihydroxy-2-naphthoate octaprenyltransferase